MSQYKVHRVRFVEFMPKAINSAAFSCDDDKVALALSREDGSIEIRDPQADWVVDCIIPGHDDRTVEHLAWCNSRLFSAGVSGEIIEWDFRMLQPKYCQDSYGGPVWCLRFSYSKKYLAAGCEDGSIRLFEVYDNNIIYERCLHKQEHRILSLSWSHDDKMIISGGFDCTMRMYNVKTGRITSRMSTDNLKNKNTMVWSVEILSDMTIVIGDSLGNTQFWDGSTGTLMQSFKSHLADVLAVVVCDDERTVYSTGVDSKVTQFVLVHSLGQSKWIQTKSVRATNYDSRTLAISAKPYNYLISGGVDPRFVVYPLDNFSSQTFVRYSCLPSPEVCQLAPNANLLLFHEQHKVHVWVLRDGHDSTTKPTKIYEVNSEDPHHIINSAISSSGKYMAYSSVFKTHLFKLSNDKGERSLVKVDIKLPPSNQLCFTNNETNLVSVGFNKEINVVNLESMITDVIPFPEELSDHLSFRFLCISHDDNYICVVNTASKCFIFSLLEKQFVTTLPELNGRVTCCSFHPETNNTFVVTSTKYVYEFNIVNEKLEPWLFDVNKTEVISRMGRMKDKVTCITFNPTKTKEIFIHSKEVFGKVVYGCPILNDKKQEGELSSKRKKTNKEPEILRSIGTFSNMMFFAFNTQGELVIVERLMSSILQKLPAALKIKTFGS